MGCDGDGEDPVGKITAGSPKVQGVVLRRWSYARDAFTGAIKEGSGCWYCYTAHQKTPSLCPLSPSQVYTICNSGLDKHKGEKQKLEKASAGVIQFCMNGASRITAEDLQEVCKGYEDGFEALTWKLKFLRIDRLQEWKRNNPDLALKHRIVMEFKKCPVTRQMIQGAGVPVQEDGIYDLDVTLKDGAKHEKTIDDGSLILSDDQISSKFEMTLEMQARDRGGISGSVTAADIIGSSSSSKPAVKREREPEVGKDGEPEKKRQKLTCSEMEVIHQTMPLIVPMV